MFGNALQLTLRELRNTFTSPKALTAIIVMGFILGVIGPFETFGYFKPLPRIGYWLFMVFVSYAAGSFGGGLASNYLAQRFKNVPIWVTVLAAGTGAGFPVALIVHSFNALLLGAWKIIGFEGLMIFVYCIVISICVALLHVVFLKDPNRKSPRKVELMARLNIQNRGTLLYLSMQDHYVNVVTSRGQELILMRMSDAIKEATDIVGVKIHRSHWVAVEGIKSVSRKSGGYQVEMLDGEKLPVSRGQVQAAKDAGIIT